MAKPTKQVVIDEIVAEIEQGRERGNLLATIGKKWQLSQRTFDRYWKTANQQHTERQQALKKELEALDTQMALEARKKAILTAEERKEILTKIAKGEIPLNKPMVVDGQIELVEVVPDWSDRRAAIAELNKMDGEYAPTKVAPTTPDGKPLSPITKVQIVPPPKIDEE